jgi:sugar phosphate isomerase/epimerase
MQDHAAQIGLLHLRDFKDGFSCALGRGDVDLAAQIKLLPSLRKLRGVIIEQDPDTANPLTNMMSSRQWLQQNFNL